MSVMQSDLHLGDPSMQPYVAAFNVVVRCRPPEKYDVAGAAFHLAVLVLTIYESKRDLRICNTEQRDVHGMPWACPSFSETLAWVPLAPLLPMPIGASLSAEYGASQ